jgi:hypothetical protein
MKVRSISFFLAATVIIAIGSPAFAQTPSCITATVMSIGAIEGIVSYNPLVVEPNGCIDGAHSIGESFGILSGGDPEDYTRFNDTATITSVSISIDYENNCSVTGVNPTVNLVGHGQFSDFNGTHGGYIYFFYSSNSGVPNLEGTLQVSVTVVDSTGNSAVYPVQHTCAPPGGGGGDPQPLSPGPG